MATTIEQVHKELHDLRKDIELIKTFLTEDFELSEHAKKALKKARGTDESKYTYLE
jgi:hypothetical protein